MHLPLRSTRAALLPVLPAAAAALASNAQAQILYTDIADLTVNSADNNGTFSNSAIYFDLDHSGGGGTFAVLNPADLLSADFGLYFHYEGTFPSGNAFKPKIVTTGADKTFAASLFAYSFSSGALIPDSFSGSFTYSSTPISGDGYLGLKLSDGSDAYYGWALVSSTGNNGSLTLREFALNTVANQSIAAGQTSAIPEPATSAAATGLAALLAGSVAFYARRRRKSAAAAAI